MYTRFYEVLVFYEIVTAFLLLYVDLCIGLWPSSVYVCQKKYFLISRGSLDIFGAI